MQNVTTYLCQKTGQRIDISREQLSWLADENIVPHNGYGYRYDCIYQTAHPGEPTYSTDDFIALVSGGIGVSLH